MTSEEKNLTLIRNLEKKNGAICSIWCHLAYTPTTIGVKAVGEDSNTRSSATTMSNLVRDQLPGLSTRYFRAAMIGEDDKIKNTWGCQKKLKPWQIIGAPEEGPPWQGTPRLVEVDKGLSDYAQVYLHDFPGHFTPRGLRSKPGQEPALISLKLWPPSSLNMCFEKSSSAACHTHICNTISRSPKEADSKPTSRGGWLEPSTTIMIKISARALFWMVYSFFFLSYQ